MTLAQLIIEEYCMHLRIASITAMQQFGCARASQKIDSSMHVPAL